MSLSDDQVRRIARLARIAIGPQETLEVQARLNRVLALVDEMRRVDTAGVEPMAHPLDTVIEAKQRLRADEVTEVNRPEIHQSIAPAVADGLYLVPKVVE